MIWIFNYITGRIPQYRNVRWELKIEIECHFLIQKGLLKNVLHTWPVTTRSSFPFKLSTLRNFCRKWTTSFTFASLFIAMIESTKQRPTMSDASFLLVNTIIIFLFCWCSSAVRRFWSTEMLNSFAPLFYIKLFAYERLHVQLSTDVLDKKPRSSLLYRL